MLEVKDLTVRKRDGRITTFDRARIEKAISGAFLADLGFKSVNEFDENLQNEIVAITDTVIEQAATGGPQQAPPSVEAIQDVVEIQLMKRGHFSVARRYIVYRDTQSKVRAVRTPGNMDGEEEFRFQVQYEDGRRLAFDEQRVKRRLYEACRGLEAVCSPKDLLEEFITSAFDGIAPAEIDKTLILAARARIEREPAYATVAARLLLRLNYREALTGSLAPENFDPIYRNQFVSYISTAVKSGRLAGQLIEFDLARLAEALQPQRDSLFTYLGLQTIYDRYLIQIGGRRVETPQYFWMRVAMGLALGESSNREEHAIEFYNLLSSFRFTSSTPTLFNAGTLHPQLSSCYLSTIDDDLDHIFKVVGDNARLSKWAGGLGNDWTNVRAMGATINGTHGESQGIIPFLKVVNDTAVAVNQGGKRKGAVCAYLEPWHLDVEEFLDLRKNTGDDRRRTHDMHTANWIPDLFMKRVKDKAQWTLFSPDEVPDLHDLYGAAFEKRYEEYEQLAADGKINLSRRISAVELWRKMLSRIFETGHPWITWKDPSNIRSPQDHKGVVHSSNLCTEILLNTSSDETAVCNLGSVNLRNHLTDGKLDLPKLKETVNTAVRMLDNVVDINFYPTPEAETSNRQHRPVGLGLMGFQDALYASGISYASDEAVRFADESMEAISYFAILASSELAAERGTYGSYVGSKWHRGLLPLDTLSLLSEERGQEVMVDTSSKLDWEIVRKSVERNGMRNSNVMAIAPTATIAGIVGVSQSIEPTYKNLFVKSNLSGDFTQINQNLVEDLKAISLWDKQMLDDIKYYDGSVQEIARVPDNLKKRYLNAFEIEPKWLIECAAARQKWIDMGQSLNLYLADPSGKKLNDMYFLAWEKGLKTTYYLRSLGATQIEKSTLDVNKYGLQPRWMKNESASSNVAIDRVDGPEAVKACSIEDPDCEACQ